MNSEMFNKGLSKRRKVLGDEYVDKALATADEFGADLQKLITEYAWGEVWNKEALSDKERSMINLGMISALNRPHELELHIKGALNNGLTKEQIKDTKDTINKIVSDAKPGVSIFFELLREWESMKKTPTKFVPMENSKKFKEVVDEDYKYEKKLL